MELCPLVGAKIVRVRDRVEKAKNHFRHFAKIDFSTFRNRNLEKTDFSHKLHYIHDFSKKRVFRKNFGNRVNLKKLFGTYKIFYSCQKFFGKF